MNLYQPLQHSWQRAWTTLDTQPDAALFQRLVECYQEPQRRYHTLQHLQESIAQLELVLEQAIHPGEVEVALWFHDAVYVPQRTDNEAQSATWAREVAIAQGLAEAVGDRIAQLILATQHTTQPQTPDQALLVDSDLAILGAAPGRFQEYEQQVRAEYAWVPDEEFCRQRRTILQTFLDRPLIYRTDPFRLRLETQARKNLRQSILDLT